jgi:hypothetical protein
MQCQPEEALLFRASSAAAELFCLQDTAKQPVCQPWSTKNFTRKKTCPNAGSVSAADKQPKPVGQRKEQMLIHAGEKGGARGQSCLTSDFSHYTVKTCGLEPPF